MSGYSDTKLANGAAQQLNSEVAPFHQADWEFQVRQFQRFLRWQHYQVGQLLISRKTTPA